MYTNETFTPKLMQLLMPVVCLLLSSNIMSAQVGDYPIIDLPKLKPILKADYSWSLETIYYDNGKTKSEYVALTDSTWLRKDYYKSGNLLLEASIGTAQSIDTTAQYNKSGDMEIVIIKKQTKTYDGNFKVYFDAKIDKKPMLKYQGTIKGLDIYMETIGRWEVYDKERNKTIIHFDDKGVPYGEYYYHKKTKSYSPKIKGLYGCVKYKDKGFDYKTYKEVDVIVCKNRPIGTWKYYDKAGKVIGTNKYKWKKP